MNPQDVVLDLLYGRWRSQTLYAGVLLGTDDLEGQCPEQSVRQVLVEGALAGDSRGGHGLIIAP